MQCCISTNESHWNCYKNENSRLLLIRHQLNVQTIQSSASKYEPYNWRTCLVNESLNYGHESGHCQGRTYYDNDDDMNTVAYSTHDKK